MNTAGFALAVYVAGLLLVFGLRTLRQLRRTGRSGWVGVSRETGAPAWWGATAFAGSLIVGLSALVLAVTGIVARWTGPGWVAGLGAVVAVVGVGVVWASQSAMGDAWRIGVDPGERTALVTGGAFGLARNPTFTGMVATQVGVVLMALSWLTGLSLLLLVVGIQIQVRSVEEPYLVRIHGRQYREYTARVGRFVPGIGH